MEADLLVRNWRLLEEAILKARTILYAAVGGTKEFPSLDHVATDCFCDLVCNTHFSYFQHAFISLINQGRRGKQIDYLLKNVLVFFSEIDQKGNMFSDKFEHSLLYDAASYITQLVSECYSSDSYSRYLAEVIETS
uniref:Cullin N-terminal domain-containing protein n=1 Tax=Kalanchoe fedtschenkoi TaxID=63787 RepID=A0A7N0U7H0_KALFE